MDVKKIIIIVEPLKPDEVVSIVHKGHSIPNPTSVHENANYIQLLEELNEQTTVEVTLVEDFIETVNPLDGIILLYPRHRGIYFDESVIACDKKLQNSLSNRLILLNVIRSETRQLIEQHRPLGIVEDLDYYNWWMIEQGSIYQRMYGLISIAQKLGVSFEKRFHENYCCLSGKKFERLSTLLIRYINCLWPEIP